MSIKYKVVKQVFGYDSTNTVRYVVRPVTGERLTFDKVRAQVSQICGIHRGVTNVVLDGLIDVLMNNLDMGHSVQLGEFATLRPGIRAKSKTSEEEVGATAIYRRKINFVPGKMLKNFLKDISVTRMIPETKKANAAGTGGNNGNSGNTNGTGNENGSVDMEV